MGTEGKHGSPWRRRTRHTGPLRTSIGCVHSWTWTAQTAQRRESLSSRCDTRWDFWGPGGLHCLRQTLGLMAGEWQPDSGGDRDSPQAQPLSSGSTGGPPHHGPHLRNSGTGQHRAVTQGGCDRGGSHGALRRSLCPAGFLEEVTVKKGPRRSLMRVGSPEPGVLGPH